ncbi:hypothetical protein DIPPA_29593 [Diplonema papillatum]|nr:hypothetical protein DIPPA_29593 [Diplonema papillatum]
MSTTKSPSIGPLRPNGAAAPAVRGRRPAPACPRKAAKSVGARPRDPTSVKRRPDAAVSAKRSASAPNQPVHGFRKRGACYVVALGHQTIVTHNA